MAIDGGTGSIRAVLFDVDGNQVGSHQIEWYHTEDPRYPQSMDFDWTTNWKLASECIEGVLASTKVKAEQVKAISTTSMREGIVLYDIDGNELWACANVDARSGDEVTQLIAQDPQLEKEIYSISGETYALGAIPRILWVKNKMPELYEKVATVTMLNDWLIYKLTKNLTTEPTNASTTGLLSLKTRNWHQEIAKKVGIKEGIFPPVYECGEKVGVVTKEASEQTGLLEGTLVIAGGGDAQNGCLGVGVSKAKQAAVFGGSFWQYEFNTDSPNTDEKYRVRVNCAGDPQLWQYEAIAFMPGLAMRWFRDAFCQSEIEQGKKEGKDPYQILDEHAAKVPVGSHGIVFTSSNIMNYISWRHAAPTFTNFGFDAQVYNTYSMYRSIMESTAFVVKGHLELVDEATGEKPEEVVFGGGASKSRVWSQILADVLGIPVKVPVVKEASALGTAMLAGVGSGIYKDLDDAVSKVVRFEKTYQPNIENHNTYQTLFERWKKVYEAQLDLSDQKVTNYMWSAPGL